MKTFTVTYHHTTNYGALLQAFALHHTIKVLGHENVIFEYPERGGMYVKLSTNSFYEFSKTLYINYLTFIRRKQIQRLRSRFEQFKKTNMNLSRIYTSMQDLKEDPPDADCLIVGSDQVWNLNTNPEFVPARFLDFGAEELLRFSYAASIERMDYTEDQKEYVREKLARFKGISLREESARLYIESFTGYNCERVLDPVFLLTKSDWSEVAEQPRIKQPYILCYQVQGNARMQEVANKLHKETGYPIVSVNCDSVNRINSHYTIFDASPQEFLGLYQNASIVVSASFHGTAFGIIYNKPTYGLVRQQGTRRISELLTLFDMKEFIIDSKSAIPSPSVDYDRVNTRIEQEREKSINFLLRMLKGDCS
jgi:hypothetical protein